MCASSFKLPDLTYDYGALEPVISSEIMTLHHSKHHNTYVTNLNAAMEKLEEATAKGDVAGIVALQQAIKFNGIVYLFVKKIILLNAYTVWHVFPRGRPPKPLHLLAEPCPRRQRRR